FFYYHPTTLCFVSLRVFSQLTSLLTCIHFENNYSVYWFITSRGPGLCGLSNLCFYPVQKSTFYYLFMAIFTLLWSSLYLETWKRRSSSLAYQWGIWDAPPPLLEEPRVAFKGKLTLCPITGRVIRTYPIWRRKLIICCFTGPVIAVCLCAVIFITLLFVRLQEHADQMAQKADAFGWSSTLLVYTPKVFLALAISLMEVGYRQVAIWLTDFENHRLDVDYHTYLVGKFILLQCMNSFYSLFYTAFYLRDLEMLQQQLTTLLITRQCIGNLREVFLPYSQSRIRQFLLSFRYERHKHKRDGDESRLETHNTESHLISTSSQADGEKHSETELRHRADHLPPSVTGTESPDEQPIHAPEREATLLPYDGPDEDFLEMFIQFGYISMFSCVFPVAASLALLNNVIEIRADAFKLIHSFQRPFVHPTHNIGVWQLAMILMGYAAVMVNIALLGVSGAVHNLFPDLSPTELIILLIAIEHCFFVMRYALTALIPDTPQSVLQQVAKLEHRRREALRVSFLFAFCVFCVFRHC
ncbi:Anoctamin, partial [Fasciolopsis buskii]